VRLSDPAPSDAIAEQIASARRQDLRIRLHLRDGEVVVAQVLDWDGERLLYKALSSSRPENYAVCDSLGVSVFLDRIARAQLLSG
jgi:hypothetical protein